MGNACSACPCPCCKNEGPKETDALIDAEASSITKSVTESIIIEKENIQLAHEPPLRVENLSKVKEIFSKTTLTSSARNSLASDKVTPSGPAIDCLKRSYVCPDSTSSGIHTVHENESEKGRINFDGLTWNSSVVTHQSSEEGLHSARAIGVSDDDSEINSVAESVIEHEESVGYNTDAGNKDKKSTTKNHNQDIHEPLVRMTEFDKCSIAQPMIKLSPRLEDVENEDFAHDQNLAFNGGQSDADAAREHFSREIARAAEKLSEDAALAAKSLIDSAYAAAVESIAREAAAENSHSNPPVSVSTSPGITVVSASDLLTDLERITESPYESDEEQEYSRDTARSELSVFEDPLFASQVDHDSVSLRKIERNSYDYALGLDAPPVSEGSSAIFSDATSEVSESSIEAEDVGSSVLRSPVLAFVSNKLTPFEHSGAAEKGLFEFSESDNSQEITVEIRKDSEKHENQGKKLGIFDDSGSSYSLNSPEASSSLPGCYSQPGGSCIFSSSGSILVTADSEEMLQLPSVSEITENHSLINSSVPSFPPSPN